MHKYMQRLLLKLHSVVQLSDDRQRICIVVSQSEETNILTTQTGITLNGQLKLRPGSRNGRATLFISSPSLILGFPTLLYTTSPGPFFLLPSP